MGGKVIEGYLCAMREKRNRDGASDAGEAPGDGENFVGKEGWEGRHVDEEEDVDVEELIGRQQWWKMSSQSVN